MSPGLRMSPVRIQIQIAFLGETKRTIPRSRPALGRAPGAGLVQDAACGTGAQRWLVLDKTEHRAMLVQVGPTSIVENCDAEPVLPVMIVSPQVPPNTGNVGRTCAATGSRLHL